ncbi:very-long-chain 3-oxoacyl-CoA reductase 1-like isoform X1 [Vicia villosa]|uniref:very-long-chain 3-oxoacyl-CoA reductase 1-like isoform X1 n=1 Tax=Vicia villosa TaxID=3911 RepID=UPI00273C8AA2|nr:very-long-chain 3-oxoacyl-CoA reductase 1-like isoform X1 [Vicia villosa]
MDYTHFFLVATATLGFISISKSLFHFLTWLYAILIRPTKHLKHYGSWAVITGSTDGIGKSMALELASNGLDILLLGRNPLKLEATSKEILSKFRNVEVKCLVVDLQNNTGDEIMRKIEEAIDGLDVGILVNGAGVAYPYARYFHEVDLDLMDSIIKVNVEGATLVTKAVIPSMIKKKKGAVVNIGSGSTVVLPSYPLVTLYAASKAYLAMFSACTNLEYKHQGIDIQCQIPLFVSTKMTRMKASLFVPTPDVYSKTCMKWIGYEKLVVPYFFHSLQSFVIRAIPDVLLDSYMLSYFLYWRKRGLVKDSKIKASANSEAN